MRCGPCTALGTVDAGSRPAALLEIVKWERKIYGPVLELEQSADKGCELCRLWRAYLIYGSEHVAPEETRNSSPVTIRKANKGGWILSGTLEVSFEERSITGNDDEEAGTTTIFLPAKAPGAFANDIGEVVA